MFIELDGRFKACCLAGKDHNINNTSIKSWMEDSKYMNDLRKEMLGISQNMVLKQLMNIV